MAIFSRRNIQIMVDRLSDHLIEKNLKKIVNKLNKHDEESLSAEWELAILYCLSKDGQIEYEKKYGRKKIDITYKYKNSITFVVEVSAISNKGYDDSNPVEEFRKKLQLIYNEKGARAEKYYVSIGYDEDGPYMDRKIILRLPKKAAWDKFQKEFEDFIDGTLLKPDENIKITLDCQEYGMTVSYRPNATHGGLNHISYDIPYSLRKNPLYNALRKEYQQIREAPDDIKKGIAICDMGCRLLSHSVYSVGTYKVSNIINEFIKSRPDIDFIVIIGTSHQRGMEIKGYYNEYGEDSLNHFIRAIRANVPPLYSVASNAKSDKLRKIDKEGIFNYAGSYLTGGKWGIEKMKVSSRMLLDLMAGNITQEFFLRHTDIGGTENPYKMLTKQGKMIESIQIEPCEDDSDDDLVVLTFKDDPATSSFKLPKKKS